MKKKILLGLVVTLLLITSCGKKETSTKEVEEPAPKKLEKVKQNLVIDEENDEDGVVEGNLEGYKFKVSEKPTDRVKLEMENGNIILIVLSNKDTPKTIKNFKKLVSEKFYDGLVFHRVVKGFMIQTGDPTGLGFSGSDDKIKGEFDENGVENNLSHTKGVISMARNNNDYDSASSQFFICQEDASESLDGKYASFGRVFAGIEVVDAIADIEVKGETPVEKPVIKSIRFIEIEK